jgi:uncharacterized membrane protein
MKSYFRHYLCGIGSILNILPKNDHRDIQDNSDTYFPLPSSAILKDDETVLPGSAERLFSDWEKAQKLFYDRQKTAIEDKLKHSQRGQWIGFSTAMLLLMLAAFWAFRGEMIFAGLLVTLAVIGQVVAFYLGVSGNQHR